MSVLVIGGTSGLGLELARLFSAEYEVIVAGRHSPEAEGIDYRELDLFQKELASKIGGFVTSLPQVESMVYAAGYYQEGRVTDLNESDIEQMLDVGGRGLIYLVRALLKKQGRLDELITITSTSQWTPRKLEPIYNFIKAGAGHFTNAMAEDGRVGKVMVAGPSGMKTDFWKDTNHPEWDKFLEPQDVAREIMAARNDDYRYKYIRILRDPLRVEEIEKR